MAYRWMPWRWKLCIKLLVSGLPIPRGVWHALDAFRHGRMDQGPYALGVFRRHFESVGLNEPFVALEMGPGDSIASALIAKAHGAVHTYLVDAGDYARKEPEVYRRIAEYLHGIGVPVPMGWRTVQELLLACDAEYLTGGIASLEAIPAGTVDFAWSHAVLEHVRHAEFEPTVKALKRCLRPGARMTHQVDLTDHLGGALNNLRFPGSRWESEAWARAGFYTNRLRCREILDLFRRHGFRVEVTGLHRWTELPTPRRRLDASFQDFDEEELLIKDFFMICETPDPTPLMRLVSKHDP